jgi:hypothetical protein
MLGCVCATSVPTTVHVCTEWDPSCGFDEDVRSMAGRCNLAKAVAVCMTCCVVRVGVVR